MHITYIYPVIIQNKSYAPGLALGQRGVSSVSPWRLQDLFLHEDLLLVLFNHLFRTPARPRSRTPPTRFLRAWNDDATLNIKATTILKIKIHLLSH